jgi:hypothetical protein
MSKEGKKNSEGLQENHKITHKCNTKHIYAMRSLLVISNDLGFSRICELGFWLFGRFADAEC